MNRNAALLPLALSIAFAATRITATTPAPTLSSAKTSGHAPQTQSLKPTPAPSSVDSANANHLFTVNDEKGLLLTCVAPEIETNPDTDLFNSCTLAPGRTLDDVMHTFVQGIHSEQNQHQKEREQWQKDLEERTTQKSAQK
jgi:hypothetical protein